VRASFEKLRPLFAGLIAGLSVIAVIAADLAGYSSFRARVFDVLTENLSDVPDDTIITIVEIDTRTIERENLIGLERIFLARLIEAIAKARPAAIGVDVVLEGADTRSPAALARTLHVQTAAPELEGLAARLPDGDRALASAAGEVQVAFGAALGPGIPTQHWTLAPILATGPVELDDLWSGPQLITPPDPIVRKAAGLGVVALPGDPDGNVRRVPLMVLAGGRPIAGLALEMLRLREGAATYILEAEPRSISMGSHTVSLPVGGFLRLVPRPTAQREQRLVNALDVIKQRVTPDKLHDRIVLIGVSAPELGGLRTSGDGDLVPSVQLQADALAQLRAGIVPVRPAAAGRWESLASLVALLAGALAGAALAPLTGGAIVALLAVSWMAASAGSYVYSYVLIDPLSVPAAILVAFLASAIVASAQNRQRAAQLQRRFEQHLAPPVVQQIIARPHVLKLAGEERDVSVLFSDIEGFTALSERTAPRQLVSLLDSYFDGISRIVIDHGGMVDKMIGDAVYSVFGAPLDLPDHPARALDCVSALDAFCEAFRQTAEAHAAGFGATRFGLETGSVIIGDVGGGRKLDYTAYGNTVNAAARLEVANKELGTRICVGQRLAARLGEPGDASKGRLRPLGVIAVRGQSTMQQAFSTWPQDYTETDRQAFLEAVELARTAPESAHAFFAELSARHPDDRALARLATFSGVSSFTGTATEEP